MSDFPTLSTAPLVSGFGETLVQDPTIRSEKCAGYVQTRAEFMRLTKKFHIEYGDLSDADKALLDAHLIDRGVGAGSFSWAHPKTGTVYVMRYGPGGIKYGLNETDQLHTAAFDLEEV